MTHRGGRAHDTGELGQVPFPLPLINRGLSLNALWCKHIKEKGWKAKQTNKQKQKAKIRYLFWQSKTNKQTKLRFFKTLNLFGSCIRTLAVILGSALWCAQTALESPQLISLCENTCLKCDSCDRWRRLSRNNRIGDAPCDVQALYLLILLFLSPLALI